MHPFMPSSHKHLLAPRHPARPIWLDPPHPKWTELSGMANALDLSSHQPWKEREAGGRPGSGHEFGSEARKLGSEARQHHLSYQTSKSV